jgi:hypothetical protein
MSLPLSFGAPFPARFRGNKSAIFTAFMVSLLSTHVAFGQTAAPKPQMAEDVFKNIQVLKGIPVDEFMGTMGIFSDALGISCGDCHALSDKSWDDYALDTTQKKKTARRMVTIMQGINKTYFNGRQVITCYSCHRAADHPKTTPDLDAVYGGTPSDDLDDFVPQAKGVRPAEQILNDYFNAIGGAQKLSAITSYIARGTSSGYGPESGQRKIEVYSKAPMQRQQVIHTDNGDRITVTDGQQAWISAPLQPIPVLPLTGGELEGAKVDALLWFPTRLKETLTNWRSGAASIVDDKRVEVVQGTAPGNVWVTLYFDPETHLLVRAKRYAASVVGRMPTQYDFADWKDVNGVKLPFQWHQKWLDGREDVEIESYQVNAPVEAARFSKPGPPVVPKK